MWIWIIFYAHIFEHEASWYAIIILEYDIFKCGSNIVALVL